MSFSLARGLVAHLASIALLFQGLELLQMVRQGAILKIWSRENLERELKAGLPLPFGFIDWLLTDGALESLAWAEIALSVVGFIHSSALVFLLLLVTHVLICIRFRGSVNGGSDSMTAILLIGLFFAYLFKKEKFAAAGLVWVAVNLLVSYFRAGLAKARSEDWRSGAALPQFLEQSFFADVRSLGNQLITRADLAKYLGLAVVALELLAPLAVFAGGSAITLILLVVAVFHFAIYWTLGLNRFFWVWLAAWPSVFYLGSLFSRG